MDAWCERINLIYPKMRSIDGLLANLEALAQMFLHGRL